MIGKEKERGTEKRLSIRSILTALRRRKPNKNRPQVRFSSNLSEFLGRNKRIPEIFKKDKKEIKRNEE